MGSDSWGYLPGDIFSFNIGTVLLGATIYRRLKSWRNRGDGRRVPIPTMPLQRRLFADPLGISHYPPRAIHNSSLEIAEKFSSS